MTAGGKNVAPAVLEDRLRAHALVDQCLVVGDGQPFIAALVTLDRESVPAWAEQHGKSAQHRRPGRRPRPARRDRGRGRGRQQGRLQGRVDPQVHDPPRRVDRGGRPAHAQPQAQAQRRHAREQGRHRRLVPPLSAACGTDNRKTPPRLVNLFYARTSSVKNPYSGALRVPRVLDRGTALVGQGWRAHRILPPAGTRKVCSMDRRRILLVVAVLVAALGSALVFLYSKGADTRAEERFDTVEVLRGHRRHRARRDHRGRAGRRQAGAGGRLAADALLDGYQTTTDALERHGRRSAPSTRASRSSPTKFGTAVDAAQSALHDPRRHDGDLGQPDRPGPRGRLRQPRLAGGDLPDGTDTATASLHPAAARPGHRARRRVDHTPSTTTTTTETGGATTEQLPRTLLTLAVNQEEAERVLFATLQR